MSDQPDVAVLTYELLKRMQGQFNRMEIEIGELKPRMTTTEGQMGQVIGHIGHLEPQIASTNRRLDRLDERVGRIERRLDLTEA